VVAKPRLRLKLKKEPKKKKMAYLSVDELQKALAQRVFKNRQDTKKAAGRALGTLVELITFYVLREWGFAAALTIELSLPEFGNTEITHNVEFGLHATIASEKVEISQESRPVTTAKVLAARKDPSEGQKANTLISTDEVLRNACILRDEVHRVIAANLIGVNKSNYVIEVCELRKHPFAMIECKRVGVEEGAKKGPTTIEKAKQGAYVAKHVSALQKIRNFEGELYAAMAKPDGTIELNPWKKELERLVYKGTAQELAGFILTVGVVSNHGNWFTSDDPNKELKVLKQSYDWLLFLNDAGIAEFVQDTLLSDAIEMKPVRKAFEDSYVSGQSGKNRFTKVKIALKAHDVLSAYFSRKLNHIEKRWFAVLSPADEDIDALREELSVLRKKDWASVLSPGDEAIKTRNPQA
jgi:hypothetical protein